MIFGLFIGSLFGCFLGFIVFVVSDYVLWKYQWIRFLLSFLVLILTTFVGAYIGIEFDKIEYNKKIANWNNTKLTLELAIKDEKISDMAKIDLVNKAIEYNMQLTDLKEDVKQWWYFYLDDEKVNKLELIDITSNEIEKENK